MGAKGQISLMHFLNGDRPIVHWLKASHFSLVSLSCISCLSYICWTSFDSCLTLMDYLHYPFFSQVHQISLATLASIVSLVYFVSFIFLYLYCPSDVYWILLLLFFSCPSCLTNTNKLMRTQRRQMTNSNTSKRQHKLYLPRCCGACKHS